MFEESLISALNFSAAVISQECEMQIRHDIGSSHFTGGSHPNVQVPVKRVAKNGTCTFG